MKMSFEDFLNLISGVTPLLILKIFLVSLILFYVVFAWVVLRQERSMTQVIEVPISPLLTLLAMIHFWAAVGLFVLALFVL